jgi:hypothetical protein
VKHRVVAQILYQENSVGVPTSSSIPGHACITLYSSGYREITQAGSVHQVDLGPWSGAKTGGPWDSGAPVRERVIWGTQRWQVSHLFMRGNW